MNLVLWGFATVLSGFFAIQIILQWLRNRKWSHLAWGIGFFFYFFSAFGSFYSYIAGWDETVYRLWYVMAAALVAFLGAGQLYFTIKPRWAHVFFGFVVLLAGAMFVKVLSAPLDLSQLALTGEEIGGKALPKDARLFSPMLTIPGSLALIGGAFYTAVRRGSKSGLWIGIGSLIIAMGGSLTRFDLTQMLPIANSIGISLIYYGFALAQRKSTKQTG